MTVSLFDDFAKNLLKKDIDVTTWENAQKEIEKSNQKSDLLANLLDSQNESDSSFPKHCNHTNYTRHHSNRRASVPVNNDEKNSENVENNEFARIFPGRG